MSVYNWEAELEITKTGTYNKQSWMQYLLMFHCQKEKTASCTILHTALCLKTVAVQSLKMCLANLNSAPRVSACSYAWTSHSPVVPDTDFFPFVSTVLMLAAFGQVVPLSPLFSFLSFFPLQKLWSQWY